MSLDGFIAGPDDDMDWVFELDTGPNPVGDEVMQSTGAILAGRRWYDLSAERWDSAKGIYGGRWTGPVFVLTHRPPNASVDPAISFVSEGIEDAVATARTAAAGKNVVIFGPTIARQCLEEGLLDEIVVHLVPMLLGDGVRLYGGPGAARVVLEGQRTDLRFRVAK